MYFAKPFVFVKHFTTFMFPSTRDRVFVFKYKTLLFICFRQHPE